MPISRLDTDQRHAATSNASETAVVAGAGSGKTRLLVGRYLYLIRHDRVPLHAIAAITFTTKAADQMKDRIAAEARALINEDPTCADLWRDVAMNAHRAAISTIHSFCSSILRRYPLEAGIDPSFTIIDRTTDVALRRDAIDAGIGDLLAGKLDDAVLLVRVFGVGMVKRMLFALLGMRQNVLAFLDAADHGHVPDTSVMQTLYERHIEAQMDRAIRQLGEFHALRPEGDSIAQAYDLLRDALHAARAAIRSDTVDPTFLERSIRLVNLRGGSKKKWGEQELKQVKAALKEVRELLESVAGYYRSERDTVPAAAALVLDLFMRVNERYRRAKQERGVLDHDDLLIETWRLLRTDISVLRAVSQSYRHLMVDEFQDTDGMQMDIVRMISGNSSASLFTVGDPKQSIYRFRGADVTVFEGFVQNIESFLKLPLNYRSAPGIVTFVNDVFGRIMGDEPRTPYDTVYYPMKANRQDIPVRPAAEIMVAATENGRADRHAETEAIVARIRELADDGDPPYAFGDMAILLRTSTPLRIYEEALLAAGIPFVNRIGGKLAGSPEAYDIGNLLGWFHAPDDPVLLTGVLASPLFSLDGDELFHLRQAAGKAASMPLFLRRLAASPEAHDERLGGRMIHAATVLAGLLDIADRLTVRELLDRAFDETGYTLVMAADPITGTRALAIIDMIVQAAEEYEAGGGLRHEFAALLRSGEPFTDETAQLETAGDAVSLMTIHGSKGLEFKVVFLADITGAGARGGGTVLFDEALGPAFTVSDERGGTRSTYAAAHARTTDQVKEHAESRRLLYVGCTRAEDLLIISGGPPAKSGSTASTNWMSWLHEALGIPPDGSGDGMTNDLFRYRWLTGRTTPADSTQTGAQAGVVAAQVGRILAEPLPPIPGMLPKSELSVSDLLTLLDGPDELDFMDDRNDSADSGHGAQYGKLFHEAAERIDLDAPDTWIDTVREVYAAADDAPSAFLDMLAGDFQRFAGSTVYDECVHAVRFYREEPFALMHRGVLIRGVIDLVYESAGEGPVLVDYKTGAMPSDGSPRGERYRRQLALYAAAYHRASGVMPSRLLLYYVGNGETVTIPCTAALLDEVSALLETACELTDRN